MIVSSYQQEHWFTLLRARVDADGATQSSVAKQLGISSPTLSQVLNGTGAYGNGLASTERIADRVLHTFGRYPCPHLTEEAGGEQRVITAEQCRAYAHRPVPTGSPRDMQHWQACRGCPHLEASAPPVPRAVLHRKVIPIAAAAHQETRHVTAL